MFMTVSSNMVVYIDLATMNVLVFRQHTDFLQNYTAHSYINLVQEHLLLTLFMHILMMWLTVILTQ